MPHEPVWYGGSKLAPDLSINRLRERLPDQEVADHPRYAADPAEQWQHATAAMFKARTTLDSDDDAAAQGHLAAFGEALYNIASATPGPHRAELRAAASAFNRARRSATRADHDAATALRQAAKELAYASNEPGGLAIALLFATVHLARAAAKWHEQRGHEQQAAAADEAFRHLQAYYQQAAAPVLADLAHRAPRAATAHRFEQDVRAALPDHADRILADPTWTALTTTLAHAETMRPQPPTPLGRSGHPAGTRQRGVPRRGPQLAHHGSAGQARSGSTQAKHRHRHIVHARRATPLSHANGHEARRTYSAPLTARADALATPF